MTLDLSRYEATETDTPEVAALKKRVIDVTKKYTTRHGWCDEANRALREMGVMPAAPVNIPITITTKQGFSFEVEVPLMALLGKTEAEQKAAVVGKVGPLRVYGSGPGARNLVANIPLIADDVTEMALKPEPVGKWALGSTNGRVQHFFTAETMAQVENGQLWVRTICRTEVLSREIHEKDTAPQCLRCAARTA
jgi:hypothetical protein